MPAINRRHGRHAPSYPSCEWLLGQSMEILASEAGREEWVRVAYAWRVSRTDPRAVPAAGSMDADAGASLFPKDAFPVLAANQKSEGLLALARLSFVSESAPNKSTRDKAGNDAAAEAVRLLRPDMPFAPQIHWVTPESESFDGGSVALSCFILATAVVLGIPIPDDMCATGGWRDSGELTPVSAETLGTKLQIAKDWGFKRLLIVEGQVGIGGLWTEEGVIVVSPRPVEALPIVVEALLKGQHIDPCQADEAFANILMVFDRKYVNGDPDDANLDMILSHTKRIIEMAGQNGHSLPLTCFLAHDMRARAYLHAGQSAEAEKEAEQVKNNLPPLPWPDGRLGMYLSHEIHAHNVMIAIDLGQWECSHPHHQRLERSLLELESDVRTRDRMLVASYLRGARGIRNVFLGRLHGDGVFFANALSDFREYGEHDFLLSNHAVSKMGMGNHGIRRRHNWIIEALEGMRIFDPDLFATCSDILDALWPVSVDSPHAPVSPMYLAQGENPRQSPYDWAAWLKWRVLKSITIPQGDIEWLLGTIAAKCDGGTVAYPWTKILETILQYRLADGNLFAVVSRLLEKSSYFLPENGNSIFSLLAVRGAALLMYGDDAQLPTPDPLRYPALYGLCSRLRGLSRERRITAVPY